MFINCIYNESSTKCDVFYTNNPKHHDLLKGSNVCSNKIAFGHQYALSRIFSQIAVSLLD